MIYQETEGEIPMAQGTCFLCDCWDELETHHIFAGNPRRKKSDIYGLTVRLCRGCHQEKNESGHKGKAVREYLHKYGQRKAMIEQGWSKEDFIREFGRNYLDDQEIAELHDAHEISGTFALIREEVELPW